MSQRRQIDSFSKEVLLVWIKAKGISYFSEELEGIEKRLAPEVALNERGRCSACNGCGREPNGQYCACSQGTDLARIDARIYSSDVVTYRKLAANKEA